MKMSPDGVETEDSPPIEKDVVNAFAGGTMQRREDVRFAVKAVSPKGPNRAELMRTMMPHPLVYQELPFDPEFGIYNNRLVALRFQSVPAEDMYWAVRRPCMTGRGASRAADWSIFQRHPATRRQP
jgi:hypothetical protein